MDKLVFPDPLHYGMDGRRPMFRSRNSLPRRSMGSILNPSFTSLSETSSNIDIGGIDRNIPVYMDFDLEPTSSRRIPRVVPRSRTSSIDSRSRTSSGDTFYRDLPIRIDVDPRNSRMVDIETAPLRVEREMPETPNLTEIRNLSSRTPLWNDKPVLAESRIFPLSVDVLPETSTMVGTHNSTRVELSPDEQNSQDDNDKPSFEIQEVDFHVLDNASDHHTDRFDHVTNGQLVIRRGQRFDVTFTLNKQFDNYKDKLCLVFSTGDKPQPGKGSHVTCVVPDKTFSSSWKTEISKKNIGTKLTVAIVPDVNCIVGEWTMVVYPVMADGDNSWHDKDAELKTKLFILFNPWNKDDSVYFSETAKLSEYVLNDRGCIFSGTSQQIGAKPWFYGQFEAGVLEAALYCVMKAFNYWTGPHLGDPVAVSRAISKIINSNDDKGVVSGNWSGDFGSGRPPLSWAGSVSILRQYVQSRTPVKFGQCFVFAGLVTTLCRALGIPCRTVTVFDAAHDSDANVTMDVHWDLVHNVELTDLNTDSIWNFHVLNTAWMRRKDLPFGNDGWQVVDATPQERSQDMYSCGPAPLSAIQSGRCDVNYDAPFVFATVNADRVHWGRQRDGTWIVISVETNVTGRKVVTKAADGRPVPASFTYCDSYMEDVTNQFKHPEESKRERMSVLLASSLAPGSRKGDVYAHNKDIEFTVKTPDNVLVGSDVTISVMCRNKVGEVRSLTGTVFVDVITYTGKPRTTCVTEEINLKLEPHDRQTYTVHVSAEKYAVHVGEAAMLRVSMLVRANESGQVHVIQELYRFRTPDLTIKCYNSTCYAGRPLSLRASFTNPFKDWPLTQCYLFVESTGAGEPKLMSLRSVPASREMSCDIELTFNQRGRHSIYATFYSRELQGIKGVLDIYVQ